MNKKKTASSRRSKAAKQTQNQNRHRRGPQTQRKQNTDRDTDRNREERMTSPYESGRFYSDMQDDQRSQRMGMGRVENGRYSQQDDRQANSRNDRDEGYRRYESPRWYDDSEERGNERKADNYNPFDDDRYNPNRYYLEDERNNRSRRSADEDDEYSQRGERDMGPPQRSTRGGAQGERGQRQIRGTQHPSGRR